MAVGLPSCPCLPPAQTPPAGTLPLRRTLPPPGVGLRGSLPPEAWCWRFRALPLPATRGHLGVSTPFLWQTKGPGLETLPPAPPVWLRHCPGRDGEKPFLPLASPGSDASCIGLNMGGRCPWLPAYLGMGFRTSARLQAAGSPHVPQPLTPGTGTARSSEATACRVAGPRGAPGRERTDWPLPPP